MKRRVRLRIPPELWLFGFALAIRLLAWLPVGWQHEPYPDEASYLRLAHNLLTSGTYGEQPRVPDASRPPMTSVIVAMPGLLGLPLKGPFVVFQMLCGAILPVIGFRITTALSGPPAAWLCGLFLASYPPLWLFYEQHVLSEVTGVLFLLLAVGATSMATRRGGAVLEGLAGVLWALCALSRTILAPLFAATVLISIPLVARGRRRRFAGIILLGFCLGYGPWVARNAVSLDSFVLFTDQGDQSRAAAYHYSNFMARGMDWNEARRATYDAIERSTTTPVMQLSERIRHALDRLLIMTGTHPKVGRRFPVSGPLLKKIPSIAYVSHFWHGMLFLGLVAFVVSAALGYLQRQDIAVFAIAIMLILGHALTLAIPRYQILPFCLLAIPSAQGLSIAWRRAAIVARIQAKMAAHQPKDHRDS
ncbi:MAG: hypothetical protein DWQ36_18235 [Acidobacteria bacterium]|nr:MAG: hypothetical protein DWQ30_15315 [Acidobacteriota bacterium]REK04370.1 MAG: hypothetical protein DWQ36_18235 [Acidobacteriota bacterium]